MAEAKWTNRLSRWAFVLVLLGLLVAAGGLTLARYDIIPKLSGLLSMVISGGFAALAALLGLIGLVMGFMHRSATKKVALVALVVGGAYAGYLGSRAAIARSVPPLHDISTDLSDPPSFGTLTLRADNLAGVETIENWRRQHATAYADIRSVTINRPPEQVFTQAEQLARSRGWAIASANRGAGQIEATASVSYIRYQDDVIIRLRPTNEGAGTIVDMRSVSRVGVSDLGMNAKRIREFMAELTTP